MTIQQQLKEHPIIFSAPMVRAILEGRKTQTRRICQRDARGADSVEHVENAPLYPPRRGDAGYTGWVAKVNKLGNLRLPLICPYGAVGDRLWVREAWYYDIDPERIPKTKPENFDSNDLYFPADARGEGPWCCQLIPECQCASVGKPKKRPPIHMPRWASRITNITLTDVRLQRLQDISEEDAIAEGIPASEVLATVVSTPIGAVTIGRNPCRGIFEIIWEHLNGKRSPWASNPWVWALTFKRVDGGSQ